MVCTLKELLKSVEEDIEKYGENELVLSYISTQQMLKDGKLFHEDQTFINEELENIFIVLSHFVEIQITSRKQLEYIQSLCSNRIEVNNNNRYEDDDE